MAAGKRSAPGRSGAAAKRRKKAAPGKTAAKKTGSRRRHPLLKLFAFLLFLCGVSGAGVWQIGEKYADNLPFYQQGRAWLYFTRDRLLMVSDRTIRIGSEEEAQNSPYDNLKYGVPAMTDSVLDRRGYALGYSEKYEQPLWVAYRLSAAEAGSKVAERGNDFRIDPYIATGSARAEDYAKSGYDRGHLAPAADMAWSEKAMSESFYFSNMSPQEPGFNRGVWRKLEAKVRDWAADKGELQVVTGPIFLNTGKFIGRNKVAVPQAYYKVLYAPKAKPPAMIGFILANTDTSRDLREFAVTVDQVESATGLEFFTTLNGDLRNQLSGSITLDAWRW
ncbi:DNA/RNA non-specific endonuclease [uncultured Victivallis sp.]|uniref:DNA/RNA non-specific endonuclease n=1 Tax=uncultured Victivallis sp. TaxID=354118 RepID=UPI0025CBA621|nr:DNA/RNA non-specific endonuclease [uncultured Victivallis sp.]